MTLRLPDILTAGSKIVQLESLPEDVQKMINDNNLMPISQWAGQDHIRGFVLNPDGKVYASTTGFANDLGNIVLIDQKQIRISRNSKLPVAKADRGMMDMKKLVIDACEDLRKKLQHDIVMVQTEAGKAGLKAIVDSVEVVEPPDQCGFATNHINISVGYRFVREPETTT